MELSYEAKRRVAPASCWPRPSNEGTSACSGVSSARVTAIVALRRRARRQPLLGINPTALDLREAKGHTSKTRPTSSEPAQWTGRPPEGHEVSYREECRVWTPRPVESYSKSLSAPKAAT